MQRVRFRSSKELTGESGISLVEIVVASGLIFLIVAAVVKFTRDVQQSSQHLSSSNDFATVKMLILDKMSCDYTVLDDANSKCFEAGSTVPLYIALKDNKDDTLIPAEGLRMGDLTVRARCQPGDDGGIEVRAAKLSKEGEGNPASRIFENNQPKWFTRDEKMTALRYDWNHPLAMVFGKSSVQDTRICRFFFNPNKFYDEATCPTGLVMQGVNPVDGSPVCKPPEAGFACVTMLKKATSTSFVLSCPAGFIATSCIIADHNVGAKSALFTPDATGCKSGTVSGSWIQLRCCQTMF